MAKRSFSLGAFGWLVVLAAVLALVYYLYEGGMFSEGVAANQPCYVKKNNVWKWQGGPCCTDSELAAKVESSWQAAKAKAKVTGDAAGVPVGCTLYSGKFVPGAIPPTN